MFIKYQHIERLGTQETEGILKGLTYIFPKIDGTNASIWIEDGVIKCGSRNRDLTEGDDNAGFREWVKTNENIKKFFKANPRLRLYGEWLVPHSLKTYRSDAWRKFYVFDVVKVPTGEYFAFNDYSITLMHFNIDFIPILCTASNVSEDQLYSMLDKNAYLIEDGHGFGEGIVIKNYEYINRFGQRTWAKIVRSEFKDLNREAFGAPLIKGKTEIEEKIVNETLTEAFIEKEYTKLAIDGWSDKYIGRLLGTIWHEFINDEMFEILKKYKNPTIDFRLMQKQVTLRIKEVKSELF